MKKTFLGKTTRAAALIMAVVLLVSGVSFADAERDAQDSGGLALTDVRLLDEFGNDLSAAGAVDAGAPVTLEYTYAPPVYDSGSGDALAASSDAGPVPLAVPTEIDLTDATFSGAAGKVLGPQTAEIASFDTGSGNTFRVRAKFDPVACVGEKTLTFALGNGKMQPITLLFQNSTALYSDEGSFINCITSCLYYNGTSGVPDIDSAPLKKDDVISKNTPIYVAYQFDVSDTAIQDGGTYTIPCPEGLQWAGNDVVEELKAKIEGDGGGNTEETFATLKYDSSSHVATIRFIDRFSTEIKELQGAYLYLYAGVDEAKIDKSNGSLAIKWKDNAELTLLISEYVPREAKIEKKGKWDQDHFHWVIEYTPGALTTGVQTIRDMYPVGEHVYVENSFKVDGVPTNPGITEATVDTVKYQTFTYTVSDTTQTHTIEYDTKLSDDSVKKQEKVEVKNKAQLMADGIDVGGEQSAKAEAPKSYNTWLQKEGKYIPEDKKVHWVITVNRIGRDLENLVLHDEIPVGLEMKGTPQITTNGGTYTRPVNGKDGEFTISFNTPYENSYKVEYDTKVSDDSYESGEIKDQSYENKAWLTFDWKWLDGTTPSNHKTPHIGKGVGVATQPLIKEYVSYDTARHEITWKITVNPHKVNVQSATVTDDLNGKDMSYVENSLRVTEGAADKITCNQNDLKKPVFSIGNIGTNSLTFEIKTTVDDSGFFAFNQKKSYTNTAKIAAQVIRSGSTIPELVASSDDATAELTSEVVSKNGSGYNYETKEITWSILVNKNGLPMANVKVEDQLPAGLAYVADSLEIGGQKSSPESLTPLVIAVGDLSERESKVVTFRTRVDVDAIKDFKKLDKLKIKNSVILKRDTYGPESDEGTQEVGNKVLNKSGQYRPADGCIDYTVKINPNGITLDGTEQLTDTLPEGLSLDKFSVALYEAAVNADGEFSEEKKVDLEGRITINSNGFTILLPAGSTRYVLEYTANIDDISKRPFTNKIEMAGTIEGSPSHGAAEGIGGGGGGGGGGFVPRKRGQIEIQKIDEFGNPLKGAEFTLGTETLVTGDNGKVLFEDVPVGTYEVTESKLPEGYLLSDSEANRLKAVAVTANNKTEVVIKNERIKADVKIVKLDAGTNAPLKGAVIAVYRKGAVSPLQIVTTGDDGIALFPGLEYGEYEYVETAAPDGYLLDSNRHGFNVENVDTIETRLFNRKIPPAPTPDNSGSGGGSGSSGSGGSSSSGNGILTPPSNSVEPGKPADSAAPADQPAADTTTREETPKDTPKEGAFDAPGDSHYVLLNPPEKGVVEIRTDGTWHYTPAPGFSGEDSFTVEIRLPGGETRTERVLVTILDQAVPKSPPNTGKYA